MKTKITAASFNEAGVMNPGIPELLASSHGQCSRFNEAGAMNPGIRWC